MDDSVNAKEKILSASHSTPGQPDTKREKDAVAGEEQSWDNEGGHMSSTAGRIRRVAGAERPYVVILAHHGSEATEHCFATMREAENFIKRNTPVPGRALSALYDRPASDF